MSVASIGIRSGNTILNYVSTTKRTKQLDLSSYVYLIGGAASISNIVASGYLYADSTGKWSINFTGSCDVATPTATITLGLNFGGNFFSAAQPLWCYDQNSGTNTTRLATTGVGNSQLQLYFASAPAQIEFGGDIRLNAEVTGITSVAANMEGVIAADVYIPPASASATGLVNTSAQTIAGVKTFGDGAAIKGKIDGSAATGYVGEMFGTETAVTGGVSYAVYSATIPTTTPQSVVQISLKKGLYLISFQGSAVKANSSAVDRIYYRPYIGANPVMNPMSTMDTTIPNGFMYASGTFTIKITTDDTLFYIYVATATANATEGNGWYLSAVRIA